MREITLRVTDEEYALLDEFRSGRAKSFHVYEGTKPEGEGYGEHILAIDDGGGQIYAECPYLIGVAPLIATALNGLFRGAGNLDGE